MLKAREAEGSMTNEQIQRLIEICNEKGWHIRYHNHPKTRENWSK
jgi:hypothetical protein